MNQQTRRHFFKNTGLGFGAMALQSLLSKEGYAASALNYRVKAKAKSIIYLHMAGSPSQIDLFENKPDVFDEERIDKGIYNFAMLVSRMFIEYNVILNKEVRNIEIQINCLRYCV